MNWNTCATFALIAESVEDDEPLTVEQIAERLDLSESTVKRSIDTLQAGQYITVGRENGARNRYTILADPPLLDRLQGWFYRFKAKEFWRRIMIAQYADAIYKKAGRVQRMWVDDPDFDTLKSALWQKHPEIRKLSAVWDLQTAIEIDQALDDLIEWGNNGQADNVATIPNQAGNNSR